MYTSFKFENIMTSRSSLRLILDGVEKIVKGFTVVRISEQKFKKKGVLPLWPRTKNGSTFLLGLEDYV